MKRVSDLARLTMFLGTKTYGVVMDQSRVNAQLRLVLDAFDRRRINPKDNPLYSNSIVHQLNESGTCPIAICNQTSWNN